jgi:hypothetical protein
MPLRQNRTARRVTPHEPPPIDPTWLDQAVAFDDAWRAGWEAAKKDTLTIDERDERLARRIVALLLQSDYQGQLVASVGATPINWRQRLQPDTEDNPTPHDYWPAGEGA